MKSALFDINIVLDLLLDREPWAAEASEAFSHVEKGTIDGVLCATSVTTLYYYAAKHCGVATARQHIGDLLTLFKIAPVNHLVLHSALSSNFSDYEDAVHHEAARSIGADAIVTRNLKDYRKSKIPALSVREFLRHLPR